MAFQLGSFVDGLFSGAATAQQLFNNYEELKEKRATNAYMNDYRKKLASYDDGDRGGTASQPTTTSAPTRVDISPTASSDQQLPSIQNPASSSAPVIDPLSPTLGPPTKTPAPPIPPPPEIPAAPPPIPAAPAIPAPIAAQPLAAPTPEAGTGKQSGITPFGGATADQQRGTALASATPVYLPPQQFTEQVTRQAGTQQQQQERSQVLALAGADPRMRPYVGRG